MDLCCVTSDRNNNESTNMRVIIDTDVGVDDAVALIMAIHGFPVDAIVGITTVFGNVNLHQANHNVAHILDAVDRQDIPVFSGATRPIISRVSDETWAGHGSDGLGNEAGAVQSSMQAAKKNDAVHALIDKAHEFSGELIVIALGPLTNVALATLIDPSFMDHVKQFVIMGGLSRGCGNLTAHAEFNVGCDPEASDIVLQHCGSPDKLFLLPFETCLDFRLSWDDFDELFGRAKCKYGGYIRKIWQFTKGYAAHEGFIPCDAYAVAMLLHPQYVTEAKRLKGRIHLAHDERRGASLWDEKHEREANVTLVTGVDKCIFKDLLQRLVAD